LTPKPIETLRRAAFGVAVASARLSPVALRIAVRSR
jgi:hypothetical protein